MFLDANTVCFRFAAGNVRDTDCEYSARAQRENDAGRGKRAGKRCFESRRTNYVAQSGSLRMH